MFDDFFRSIFGEITSLLIKIAVIVALLWVVWLFAQQVNKLSQAGKANKETWYGTSENGD